MQQATASCDSTIIVADAVDRSELVNEELLRRLENNEWQSCTQFSESMSQMPWGSQSMSVSRMANDSTNCMGSSAMFDVYIVFKHTSGYLQSDTRSHCLRMLALMWNISHQSFV